MSDSPNIGSTKFYFDRLPNLLNHKENIDQGYEVRLIDIHALSRNESEESFYKWFFDTYPVDAKIDGKYIVDAYLEFILKMGYNLTWSSPRFIETLLKNGYKTDEPSLQARLSIFGKDSMVSVPFQLCLLFSCSVSEAYVMSRYPDKGFWFFYHQDDNIRYKYKF